VIIEAVLTAVIGLVTSLVTAVLPTGDMPALSGGVSGAVHLYSWLNTWAPVSETLEMIALTLEVLIGLGGVYVVVWVLTRLHILGGST
jgi:hypothetical protein